MADISKVKMPNNSTTYDIISKTGRGIVRCETDSSSTSTAFVVTVSGINSLYDGIILCIKNTKVKSAANCTINLNGLGAKRIWLSQSNDYCTTHWGLNTTYLFIYDATNERWELQQGRDTDSNDGQYYDRFTNQRIKAGSNKIFPYTIICQLPDGRWESIVTSSSTGTSKTRNTHGFLFGQIALMYANKTYAENAEVGNSYFWIRYGSVIDHRYSFNTANNSTYGTTSIKPIYLVGSINSDGLYYLDTIWWTQTLPSSADGKIYTYIGDAYDYYQMTFNGVGKSFIYTNGALREFTQDSATVTGHTVAKDVPSNAEFTDTQSDWNATSGKAAILNKPTIPTVNNGTLTIQKNGTQVATFTANQSGNSTANITVPTVTDTYSSTGTDATSGKAVAAALGTLDGTVSGTAGASKTLTAFSQTDGKVSATFGNISITKSQVSDFPTLGTAAAKNYTSSVTSGSADLVTSGAVYTAIDNLPEPMVFKGTLGPGGTITSLPTAAASNEGYTYKVITAGTYASQAAKIGDVFVSAKPEGASAYSWILIPAGDTDSDTWRAIKVNGTQLLGSAISTGAVNFKNGSNVTITGSGNDITIASTDTNTTYTFANGTNGFTVTPSGGTAQTVTVTPSITNNITGSGTSGSFVKFTGAHTIGDATAAVDSATTGISIADHSTTSINGVQATTTTASKVTLGTAISVPNVTSAGSASNWVFENITVPKAASSATSIPNVTAVGSGDFTQGTFSGGSGSFTATVTNGVLSFSHTHTAATHGADSHTHTAPTLGTAISVTGVSGSTTASHVKSGGNGTAPTLGTAISVPNVTGVEDVIVPIKNTSATTVVTSKTHSVTDNGHTHILS